MKRLVSLLQKVKTFFFYSDNLTDCLFAAESEEIGFFTAESEEIVSLLQKVKMFFFYSDNLIDCFFAAESEEIGFFTAECEDILFCADWFFHCGK